MREDERLWWKVARAVEGGRVNHALTRLFIDQAREAIPGCKNGDCSGAGRLKKVSLGGCFSPLSCRSDLSLAAADTVTLVVEGPLGIFSDERLLSTSSFSGNSNSLINFLVVDGVPDSPFPANNFFR